MHSLSTAAHRNRVRLFVALQLVLVLVAGLFGLVSASSMDLPVDPRLALPPLQAPGEWFDSQRSIDGQAIDYAGAIDQAAALRVDAVGGEWTNLGPTNIGGRVNDVVTDADSADIVYAATASGGVWRSTDRGLTWDRAWPDDMTQAIGSLARNGNLLLAGTGEANPGGGSIVYGGTGAYVSADDGATWELIGLEDSGAIGRVFAHGDGFLIAATGNLFVPGGERGLYYWAPGMDAPELWFDAIEMANDTTGAVDIAVDPANDDHIIVGLWDHSRTPDARYYSGEGSGAWVTHDGGDTWDRIEAISVANPDGPYLDRSEDGRVAVAFAPSDPNRVYAEVANIADGTHGAFYVSSDGGQTWEYRTNSTLRSTNSSYGWWFGRIYVDPADADRVFVMGLNLTVSTNGGSTFSNLNNSVLGLAPGAGYVNPHSDQHGMVWDERVEGLVYLANDGGVYTSTDNGENWISSPLQGWTQHYSVDVADVGTGDQIVTGLQDNGCVASYGAGGGDWVMNGLCGDGLESVFQPGNPAVSWSCSQYGGCQRNVAGAGDLGIVSFPGGDRWGWLADIEYSPADVTNNTLFTGDQGLWRSTNNGVNWSRFGPADLSSDPVQLDPNEGYRLRGVVTTIAPGHNGELVWAGTDEGRLWKITADGADHTLIDAGLPDAWITSVTTDPADDNVAYVTYSGFRGGSDAAHVFVTTDGGATFTDLSANLPNAPVNDVIVADDRLVVATDVGVFVADRTAESVEWDMLGTNLPAVPVIQVDFEFGRITAATFGHGIQRIDFPAYDPARQLTDRLG